VDDDLPAGAVREVRSGCCTGAVTVPDVLPSVGCNRA
jgi:hypothetical protein